MHLGKAPRANARGARPAPYAPRGPAQANASGKSVYIGNLSWSTSWQDLKDHCKTVGPVTHADVMLEPDGRSKGCGMVEFARAGDAARAIAELNDSMLNDRKIFVREDREAGKAGAAGASVYVGNLSWRVSWQDLKDHCKQAGNVLHADVMQEPDGRSKGCGLVQFATAKEAANAITTLHDTELSGRQIFVREDRETGKAGGATVYVGNLSWRVSWQDLKDHCKQAGNVLYADVMQEPDGRSKGCGLVQFATAKDAANAIATLHDTAIDGRKIFVREDREASRQGGRETAGPPGAGCKLYVGNLTYETSWMDLKDLFREAGQVVRTDIVADREGNSRGFGTVEMASTREAARAIQTFNETEYNGRALDVRPDAFS